MTTTKKFLPVRLAPELIAEIDAAVPSRGRTKFVEAALREKLDRIPSELAAIAAANLSADTGITNITPPTISSVSGSSGEVVYTQAVATCAHIVLGPPRGAAGGLIFRDCRACGQAQLA